MNVESDLAEWIRLAEMDIEDAHAVMNFVKGLLSGD